METPWKVLGAFVGVFIAGAIFGGFFTLRSAAPTLAQTPPPVVRPKNAAAPVRSQPITVAMLQNLRQRLKLTDEQQAKITPLVARAESDLQRLRRENFQNTTRVMERLHTDIRA